MERFLIFSLLCFIELEELGCNSLTSCQIKTYNESLFTFLLHPIKNFCDRRYYYENSICGIGTISDAGYRCVKWASNDQLRNTRFCKKYKNYYYCYRSYINWDYCKNVACLQRELDNICDSNIYWNSDSSSIELDFSQSHYGNDILVMFQLNEDDCQVYQICKNCSSVNKIVTDYFKHCNRTPSSSIKSSVIVFKPLNSTQNYIFYLIPVIDEFTLGTIAKLTLPTDESKIDSRIGIRIIRESSKSFTIIWDSLNHSIYMNEYQVLVHYRANGTELFVCNSSNSSLILESSRISDKINFTVIFKGKNGTIASRYIPEYMTENNQKHVKINLTGLNLSTKSWQSNKMNDLVIRSTFQAKPCEGVDCFPKLQIRIFVIVFLILLVGCIIYGIKRLQNNITENRLTPINESAFDIELGNRLKYVIGQQGVNRSTDMYKFEFHNVKEKILKEYKAICVHSQLYEHNSNLTTKIAELPENWNKNRFVNILPYDQTRVILKGHFPESDYINATLIPFFDNQDKVEYIASQGPVEESISDFWLMVLEQNIPIIVMLTRTVEDNQIKCCQYWPNEVAKTEYFGRDNEFLITVERESRTVILIERNLKVFNKKTNKVRNIIHLHMQAWTDFSVPQFVNLQIFINRFHELSSQFNFKQCLVHCSAGVGRTGTFIVIDRILKRLINGSKTINVMLDVLELRKYRKYMVQKKTQYSFIHEFIQYFLTKSINAEVESLENENVYFNYK